MAHHVHQCSDSANLALALDMLAGDFEVLQIAACGTSAWVVIYRDKECGGCGLPLTECTAPANEDRYKVPPPVRCHACTAIAKTQRRGYPVPQALRFTAKVPA